MIKRLNLGASRLEKLSKEQLEIFLDKTWMHLGEENLENPNNRHLVEADYSKTNFQSLNYKKGDKLNFKENFYEHIFSEHFFEHLFVDEAMSLFEECYRILKDKGVMRLVVPDADLRPVPEKVGFPGEQYSWDNPRKHKTRWSIYSLKPLLEQSGFIVVPLKYYDNKSLLNNNLKDLPLEIHKNLLDLNILSETKHIRRKNSLIVDAIK